MNFFKDKFSGLSNKKRLMLTGITAIFIITLMFFVVYLLSNKKEELIDYDYNAIEQQIADSVKVYLSLFFELSEDISAQVANEAVETYNIILTSVGVEAVNDEHTAIIKQRIRKALLILIDNAEELSGNELDSLSAGITEIIWNAILNQIEEVVVANNYEQEYIYLTESIQKQIDELAEQKMRITISAKITDNEERTSDNIDAASLLAAINEMTDDDLQKLAAALGISPAELQKLLNANNLALDKELEEKLAELKKEISDELLSKYGNSNTSSTKNGSTGQNGTNGKNGKDGKDGEDGRDGSNGKTTYIAYADDMNGAGFSLTPTETSKYVGTCITDADKQPTEYKSYSNWQIYRTYIITTTTDENNITTVHIN